MSRVGGGNYSSGSAYTSVVAGWLVTVSILCTPALLLAQDNPVTTAEPPVTSQAASSPASNAHGSQPAGAGLSVLDWAAIGAYAVAMLAIGWTSSRKTNTTEEYLLGGRRLKPWSVGLSLFATLISTISYLAVPGEVIKHGPVFLTYIAAIPIIYLITGYLLIPYIMRLPVTSAYEILEGKLGIEVRLLGSMIFLMTRIVWMGLIIYTSSKAVVVMLGIAPGYATYLGAAMSLVTILYTSVGGLRASVATGAVQTFVLLGGAVTSVLYVTYAMGGIRPWWPSEWASNWDSQPFFSFDPHVRVTVLGMVITTTVWWICTAGSDQMAIQRYLSTRDAKTARRAFLYNNCADVLTTLSLAFLGFALLAFFRTRAHEFPASYNLVTNADYLFPYFIVNILPGGLGGLVVAGLLAAAMSSLSAGYSSCSAVITSDFIDRFRRSGVGGQTGLTLTRSISVAVGALTILLSLVMVRVPGNILEVTNKTTNLFVAPLFSLFFMAIFVPFATKFGAFQGAIYGVAAAALVGYWDVLTGRAGLSWTWLNPAALVVAIIAGCLFSLLPTRGRRWPALLWWTAVAATPLAVLFYAVTTM